MKNTWQANLIPRDDDCFLPNAYHDWLIIRCIICCYLKFQSIVEILVRQLMVKSMAHGTGPANPCHLSAMQNIICLVRLPGCAYPLVNGVGHSLHVSDAVNKSCIYY